MSASNRKLAAIVFTDIVGFTRLSADNQSKSSALIKKQRETFQPIVQNFKGTWVKEMGDGLLLTFDTITDAVKSSIEMQKVSKDIEGLNLRIGIHLGEVIVDNNDVLGDDVNIASRIEPFSAPGGIAISNKVNDAIIREDEYETKYIGKPKLKGVGQKVEVFCITSHNLIETDLSSISPKLEKEDQNKFKWNVYNLTGAVLTTIGLIFWINVSFLQKGISDEISTSSIAILPFDNKGDEKDEFYSYGISSDLISDVTSSGTVRVVGLNDIEKLDIQKMNNEEISNELRVKYLVKGTMWRMDSLFQLSIEIFDKELSKIIFSNRWETNWNKLALIKKDLSKEILNQIDVNIIDDIEEAVVKGDPLAYEHYLRAKYQYKKRENKTEIKIVQDLLRKAIELDESLVDARFLLSKTHRSLSDYDSAIKNTRKTRNWAKTLNNKKAIAQSNFDLASSFWMKGNLDSLLYYNKSSLKLGAELDNKYFILRSYRGIGSAYGRKQNHDSTLFYHQKSLELANQLADTVEIAASLSALGTVSYFLDDEDKSFQYSEEGLRLYKKIDKKSAIIQQSINVAWIYNRYDKPKDAIKILKQALTIAENENEKSAQATVKHLIAESYGETGEYDKAINYYTNSIMISRELGDENMAAYSMRDMGYSILFNKQKKIDEAILTLKEAVRMLEKVGNKHGIGWTANMLGNINLVIGDYSEAIKLYTYVLGIQTNDPAINASAHFGMGESYYFNNKLKKAENCFDRYESVSVGDVKENLYFNIMINLIYKKYGDIVDASTLENLINEKKEISYDNYFLLYQVLDDEDYLKRALEALNDELENVDIKSKKIFKTYPIPKQILELNNSLSS